jgi:hypothetical protein
MLSRKVKGFLKISLNYPDLKRKNQYIDIIFEVGINKVGKSRLCQKYLIEK